MIPQIQLNFYWPKSGPRSEVLENSIVEYLKENGEADNITKMSYVLEQLKDQDFAIFTFGKSKFDYVQFSRMGSNIVLNFPYSVGLGVRYLQIDRVDMLLRRHGFANEPGGGSFTLVRENERYMYFEDTLSDHIVCLDAYFGISHERFAAEVAQEIGKEIFRYKNTDKLNIKVGSWKS